MSTYGERSRREQEQLARASRETRESMTAEELAEGRARAERVRAALADDAPTTADAPMTDTEYRELLDGLAQDLESAEVVHTGGNIWCVQVDGPGESFALIGEGFTEDDSLALGVYTDVTDEGSILKEWSVAGLDASEHADIVRTTLATYWGTHR